MSDEEENKLRAVLKRWIVNTPEDYEMTRLELREHPNEITVGSQTGMRKGNQYALAWSDIDFKLRLITLPDTKTGVPHTVPMTDDVENTTLKMQQPDGTDKTTSQKMRICITESNWLRLMGPTAKDACPKTNEVWSKNSYSFDVGCAGKPKQASVAIHFDSLESQHGSLDDYETPNGKPMKMHGQFKDHWVSAECGDVSTENPVILR